MTDKKTIIKALECCVSPITMCGECPYGVRRCMDLKRDVLELLKPKPYESRKKHQCTCGCKHIGLWSGYGEDRKVGYSCRCDDCGKHTKTYNSEMAAIRAWNNQNK